MFIKFALGCLVGLGFVFVAGTVGLVVPVITIPAAGLFVSIVAG